jgi:hypothetical protein
VTAAGDSDREGGADAEHPEHPEQPDRLDVDAAFAAIIAGWADDTPGDWPAEEDITRGRHRRADDPATDSADIADPAARAKRPDDAPPAPGEMIDLGPAPLERPLIPSIDVPLEDPIELLESSEGYAPPEPPPLPRGDLLSRLSWAGVICGPLVLLITVITWRTAAPQLLVLASIAAFVAGFVSLVARMPKHRPDDDDDGAVV